MPDEQTILDIADTTQRLLNALEASLDGALRRGVSKDECEAEGPLNPSIVGEIIDLMHENNKRLADISEQIRLEVLAKLDRLNKPTS